MNKSTKGNPKQNTGSVKKRWGEFTDDDDLDMIEVDSRKFSGKFQGKYGKNKNYADQEIREFEREQE